MYFHNTSYVSINSEYTTVYELVPKAIAWVGITNFSTIPLSRFDPLKTAQQKISQQQAVRLLLATMLKLLGIDDNLIEAVFPYRLQHNGYYVCFSHSIDQVSCAISRQLPIAIDSEINSVSNAIAERFFHVNELSWLSKLFKLSRFSNQDETQLARNLLWMIKESFVKIGCYPNLMIGLKADNHNIANSLLICSQRNKNIAQITASNSLLFLYSRCHHTLIILKTVQY